MDFQRKVLLSNCHDYYYNFYQTGGSIVITIVNNVVDTAKKKRRVVFLYFFYKSKNISSSLILVDQYAMIDVIFSVYEFDVILNKYMYGSCLGSMPFVLFLKAYGLRIILSQITIQRAKGIHRRYIRTLVVN